MSMQELISRLRPGQIELLVTPEELQGLMEEIQPWIEQPRPKPPIKRKVDSSWFGGLFAGTTGHHNEIEYDYHAPEYLKALEDWERKTNRPKAKQDIGLQGPYGYIRVVAKPEEPK